MERKRLMERQTRTPGTRPLLYRPHLEELEGRLALSGHPLVGPFPEYSKAEWAGAPATAPTEDESPCCGDSTPDPVVIEDPSWAGMLLPLFLPLVGPLPIAPDGGLDLFLPFADADDVARFRFDPTITGPFQVEMWPTEEGIGWVRILDEQGEELPLTNDTRDGLGHVINFEAEEGRSYILETGVDQSPTATLGRLLLLAGFDYGLPPFAPSTNPPSEGEILLESLADLPFETGVVPEANSATDLIPLPDASLALVARLGGGALRIRPVRVLTAPEREASPESEGEPAAPRTVRPVPGEAWRASLFRLGPSWLREPIEPLSGSASPPSAWEPDPSEAEAEPFPSREPLPPGDSTTDVHWPTPTVDFRTPWELGTGEEEPSGIALEAVPGTTEAVVTVAVTKLPRARPHEGPAERPPTNRRSRFLLNTLFAVLCTWGIHQSLHGRPRREGNGSTCERPDTTMRSPRRRLPHPFESQ